MAAPLKPTKRHATYDDVRALPDTVVGEILGGELFVSPRPASPHARVRSVLGIEIGGPFDRGRGGPGGWWILDEPELHLGSDIPVPDLAGWRRERLAVLADVPFFTLAPDWVCEVLSPSTAGIDRVRKLRICERERVGHVWLVDPAARTLEVLRLGEPEWRLVATHNGDEMVRAEPFDAVALELAALWLPEPPPVG